MKYVHTNIISSNWKQLAQFYIQVFQCKIIPPVRSQEGRWLEKGTGVIGAKLEGVHLKLPGYGENGPTLEIYQYAEMVKNVPIAPNQIGLGHLAFEVENVEETLSDILLYGGKVNGSISKHQIDGVGTITFVYARDPEGNLVELQHWD